MKRKRHHITRTHRALAAIAVTTAAVVLSAGGASGTAARHSGAKANNAGVTIDVIFAYPEPKALVAQFTRQTGIHVNWTYMDWDTMQVKIAAAGIAKVYYADVTDVDWSKVGEFATTGWFLPLNKYFNVNSLQKQFPQLSTYLHDGKLIAVPSDSSIGITTINKNDLKRAGIASIPATFAQYVKDLDTIRAKGVVAHPLDIPFAAAEGLSGYWYTLTEDAFGGQVLTTSYQPAFTSPNSAGYRALAWMVNAYKTGLVPPANINYTDAQGFTIDMAHNKAASVYYDYSGDVATVYNVPSDSSVVGQTEYIPVPGVSGPAASPANPDGFGIPVTVKHLSAALAFTNWYTSAKLQADFAGAYGPANTILGFPNPATLAGLKLFVASKSPDAQQLANGVEHSKAFFANGAPPWYPVFSNAVYTNIHDAAAGTESVAQAIKAIAATVRAQNS